MILSTMTNIAQPTAIVAGIAALMGVVLTLAAKFMQVKVDETLVQVREALPGINCGACGFAGCDDYAAKLAQGGVATNLCTPGGAETAKAVSAALGVEAEEVTAKYAQVRCAGTCDFTTYILDYQGPPTCESCNYFYQGRGSCSHACLGFGDCVTICPHDAIALQDGVAVVDKALCVGCGLCASRCPNHLIKVVPVTSDVYVACSSTDKGAFTRKVCGAGCIGCKKCQRTCRFGAVTITDNLAFIDPDKCTNCGECIAQCPTKVIRAMVCSQAPAG